MKPGCDSFRAGLSRRDLFRVGGTGLFGLTLTDFFRAEAAQPRRNKAWAKQAIFIFLTGGPSQLETFDMKPDRPDEIRGPFKPIATSVPGLQICEHLPRLAKAADRYTILRSVTSVGYPNAGDHNAGNCWKTGNPRGIRGTPKFPMYGSVVAKFGTAPRDLPAFVELGAIELMAPGLRENYLGPAYDPLTVNVYAGKGKEQQQDPLTRMLAPAQLDVTTFDNNVELLRALEQQVRRQDAADPLIEGLDTFQQKAFDLLRSPKLREALDLTREPAKNLDRYAVNLMQDGKSNYTRRMLAARRLIEAGVPFVYLDLPYWDWHGGVEENNRLGMNTLTALDTSLSALLEDLADRGLLQTTAVIATGEMGRTPKVNRNGPAARDHWASAQIVLAAGGGFQAGAVVGATDRDAATVKDREYRVASLGKTLYHLLGFDPDQELITQDNRPLKLITQDVPIIKEAIV